MYLQFLIVISPLLFVMGIILKGAKKPNGSFFLASYLPILIITQAYFLFFDVQSDFLINFSFFDRENLLYVYIANTFFYVFLFLIYFYLKSKDVTEVSKVEINFFPPSILVDIFLVTGFLNFLWNVYTISGFDILNYIQTISIRGEQFSDGGTTFFYMFSMFSGFVYTHMYSKGVIGRKKLFICLVIITIILFSKGRVTNTLSYFICLIVIFYNNKDFYLYRFLKFFYLFLLVFFVFYLYRVYSSFALNGLDMELDKAHELLTFYLFDKGNTPNILVEYFIMSNYYDVSNSPMYGVSVFSSIIKFFTNDTVGFIPSIYIKENFFGGIYGGALPPTMPGEAVLNFGAFGLFIFPIFLGILVYLIDRRYERTASFLELIIIANIIGYFLFASPKGEFDNFPLLQLVIFSILYYLLAFSTKIIDSFRK